ncbi:MAG: hypothetical protein R8G34_00885 [Paracoccaceae bacterium]|nr:hypothetical protein [Paracoccaceae bacterium]
MMAQVRHSFLICAAALFISAPALAQSVVGTSAVEGRTVTLFSDGTWKFANPNNSRCITLQKALAFCGQSPIWQRTPAPRPDITAQFRKTDTDFVQFIAEDIVTAQGLTQKAVKAFTINMAASPSGIRPEELPILSDTPSEIDGRGAQTIVYAVVFEGTPLVFANTIVLEEARLLQLQSYRIGADDYSEDHRAFRAAFLNLIDLD